MRLLLAKALYNEPDLLLLDEPTVNIFFNYRVYNLLYKKFNI